VTGTERSVRIAMADGIELAVSLFLPDADSPQPCLLEALPYRKDDLTSSYAESYRALRDTYGYAVARVDLRGTGSSGGDATDEYPLVERTDLCAVIAWLADQEWCDGNVGMFGTSYSGFNALQIAAERPPALKAVCAIYSSDDRWSDDVHWRGHALRLVDLVDYDHYMTPMCVLPPVPSEWPGDWKAEWVRRLETNEPWLLTWLRENRDGPYWRAGSLRHAADGGRGYDRIEAATMIVAGWADGYRNNSFRTVEALGAAGTPWRLLAGPWAHADPATAIPGPRIDLDVEMAAWFDRWLRDRGPEHADRADLFVRTSTVPEPDLDLHEGYWVTGSWPPPGASSTTVPLDGPRSLEVQPDVGTSAWIDCAGHLPWGLSGDQREDDARSLTWDSTPPSAAMVGQPRVRLRVSASAPAASLSVKLCDVFPDGTSALVSRGTLDLRFRDATSPAPLVPGEEYEIDLLLDACAYQWSPGQTLRVSVAGSDWPNTIAPPAPVTLTVHGGSLELPLWPAELIDAPAFTPGSATSSEDPEGVIWSVTRDVLRRTTTCAVRSGATYEIPHGGTASEDYVGEVSVDRRTFAQWADATTTFTLTWEGIDIRVTSTLRVDIGAEGYDVLIDCDAFEGDELVSHREWRETIPR
jgi:predicted acyl esterase